jgi:hypothetical protein
MTAVARRLGIDVDLAAIDRLGHETPVLVDLKPSGRYYMEDLHSAGGLIPVLRELRSLLNSDCLTVTGCTLSANLEGMPPSWPQDVVRTLDNPLSPQGGIAVLTGNLAPASAIIKHSAASPDLLQHTGRAVVFRGPGAAHRQRRSGRASRRYPVAAKRRAKGRTRDARSRVHPDPAQARTPRRKRHGAYFRCAHERYRLRHGRWRWCETGTRFGSMFPRVALSCWSKTTSCGRVVTNGVHRRLIPAATAGISSSSSITCSRRIRGVISIFW